MKFTTKIKAGALQFVLFIGAVVAVLLMAFMLLSHTHSLFDKKTDVVISIIKGVDFGINSSLNKPIALGDQIAIKDENDLSIDIQVKRDYWGIFEKRTVMASHGKTNLIKTALVGGKDIDGMPALYVSDKQRPVIIAGNSSITGTAFLPKQGIKMGNIHGNSYHRNQLVYGKKLQSKATLPQLCSDLQMQLNQLAKVGYVPQGEMVSMTRNRALKNSFHSPTKIIRDRVVHLKDMQLTGNIIVSASDKIIVEASAQLNDVVLLAPKIIIKDWVNGYFQAIASESITVGKKCLLPYPTALVVNKKGTPRLSKNTNSQHQFTNRPSIYIDSYTEIGGVVMALENSEERQFVPQIKIDDNAKVVGEVYCTKNLELKGRVNGSVTTAAFVALENGSVYQNHLYNGMINSTHLPRAYVGLLSQKGEQSKKIMKWLY
jgi:hypothetical protein